jgi:D-aminoacyl-tRNA deacylase
MLRNENLEVQTGIFQTEMKVSLVNDGPVTIIIDSSERLKPTK